MSDHQAGRTEARRTPQTVLITGGASSGKSALAERLARSWQRPVVFIATAVAGDADMTERIARHRSERPAEWTTVEEPLELLVAVGQADPAAGLVIDCLTMWATNHYLDRRARDLDVRAVAVAEALAARPGPAAVITNEVGDGVVPATEQGREFRDLLGRVNRVFAATLDRALLVVAGQLIELHPPGDLVDFGDQS